MVRVQLFFAVIAGACCLACSASDERPSAAEADAPAPKSRSKTEGRIEPVGVQTQLDSAPPTCDPVHWCGPRTEAKARLIRKKPASLGCPAVIGDGSADPSRVFEVDETATASKRGAGDEGTCCYVHRPACDGAG